MRITENLYNVMSDRTEHGTTTCHLTMSNNIKKELKSLADTLNHSQAVLVDLALYNLIEEYNREKKTRDAKRRESKTIKFKEGYLESLTKDIKPIPAHDPSEEF